MSKNLCLHCGEARHVVASCPKRFGQTQQNCEASMDQGLVEKISVPGRQPTYIYVEILALDQPITSINALVNLDANKFLVN